MRELADLQTYTTARVASLHKPLSKSKLKSELQSLLIKASNQRKIKTPPKLIAERVILVEEPPPQVMDHLKDQDLARGAFCIFGGSCEKNQQRDTALPHFVRDDGAWFDFSITARETDEGVELLAYDFELRLAPGGGSPFLRFDLNLPDHHNEHRELRAHVHPGSDDVLIPAPLMSPSEVLALFIDGVRLSANRKPRTPTAFEIEWLARTLASHQKPK